MQHSTCVHKPTRFEGIQTLLDVPQPDLVATPTNGRQDGCLAVQRNTVYELFFAKCLNATDVLVTAFIDALQNGNVA
jgi:hypothetical protein